MSITTLGLLAKPGESGVRFASFFQGVMEEPGFLSFWQLINFILNFFEVLDPFRGILRASPHTFGPCVPEFPSLN